MSAIELTDGELLRLAAERLALAKTDVPLDEDEESILHWLTKPDPDLVLADRVQLIGQAVGDLQRAVTLLLVVIDQQKGTVEDEQQIEQD